MNGKKNLWIRTLKIIALVLPAALVVLLFPVNDFGDTPRIRYFYLEEPNSLDVVILGSSENYAGYSPVLAYEEYGFTSYPYVFSANAFSLFEAQLEAVLRVQSPQIIVVDIGELIYAERDGDTVFRQLMAGIPFSWHKVELIRKYGDSEQALSYYFPFFVNHGISDLQTLWQYIQEDVAVRQRGYSLLKGAITFTGSGETWDGPYVAPRNTTGDSSMAPLQPEVAELCQQVLDACGKHPEIQFLFINTPHRITTQERYLAYQTVNAVGALIAESGYHFLNLESMTDAIGIVPETDFYNNHHMNLYGQYKATRFLCDILTGEYGLEARQLSPENQEKWSTCVAYQHLYYQLFDEAFKARQPGEFGLWLQEDAWLLKTLEEMRLAQGDIG